MKKLEKFLFFYCLVGITVFFISHGVFEPSPLNLVSGISVLPVLFYLWINLTSPKTVSSDKWSVRFILSILFLSGLGIYGYSLAKMSSQKPDINSQLLEVQSQNEELKSKLEKIKAELSKSGQNFDPEKGQVAGESIADLLSETPSPASSSGTPERPPIQSITGKPGINSITIYKEANTSSSKVGSLDPDQKYTYISKSDGWYKVPMPGGASGWVSATEVKEVQ